MEVFMKTITLRKIPSELARIIQKKAKEEKMSMCQAVIRLLEENLGLRKGRKGAIYSELDSLSGAWTREEADEFDKTLREQRTIDPELWE
jgi:DNA polymerase III delta subunit